MDRDLRIRMLLEAGDRASRPLRDIANGGSRAAEALKATRDRLKQIETAQADVAGFRQLKAGLRTTEQAMQAVQTRVGQLSREIAQAETPTRAMTRDLARAREEAQRLTRQQDAESRQLQELRDRLRAAGIATTDLARHERELRGNAADTNRELEEQTRRLAQATDRQRRFSAARESFARTQNMATGLAAGGAASVGTGMAMGAGIWKSVKSAQEYESTMTDIAQKANLSRVEAEKMGVGLLTAARAANQLPDALQAGVDTLAGFGLDPRQAVAMMRPIGRAATAYKAEIADLSAAAFAANDNLKVPVTQTARVIDIMAQAGKAGAFEIKDMAGAFPALTAGYQALGQTGTGAVADLAAALQIARKGAGDSATAANNVANIIQKISSPASIKAFSKFGIDLPNALKKAYADGKTPLEAIAELTKKATGGDLGKIGFLFEDSQVQQGLRPLIQNMEEYRRIRKEAAGASGVTDTDFAERMRDSAEKTKQLGINAQALSITMGGQLTPSVDDAQAKASSLVERLQGWAERNPVLAKGVMIVAGSIATLFVVLGGAAIVAAGLVAPFAIINAGMIAMGIAGGLASIGLLPIIGTIAAIAGAMALLYAVFTHWDAIYAFFAALPGKFATFGRNLISGLIGGITGMLGQLKDTIIGAAGSAARWFKEKLGIHSPSRVFAGFGGFMMQGLENGIAGGQDGPIGRIDTLSRRMTRALAVGVATGAAAMPAAAAGPGGAGGVGASWSAPLSVAITINPPAGADAQDIAAAVRRELERIQREQARTAASTFADPPDWT